MEGLQTLWIEPRRARRFYNRRTRRDLEVLAQSVALRWERVRAARRKLDDSALKRIDTACNYLADRTRTRLMHHAEALRDGLPIATGVIEGACRYLVKDRVDRTGARWSLIGAEAVLRLRAVRASGDFDAYRRIHLAREKARNHAARDKGAAMPDPLPAPKPRLTRVKGSTSQGFVAVEEEPHPIQKCHPAPRAALRGAPAVRWSGWDETQEWAQRRLCGGRRRKNRFQRLRQTAERSTAMKRDAPASCFSVRRGGRIGSSGTRAAPPPIESCSASLIIWVKVSATYSDEHNTRSPELKRPPWSPLVAA